MVNKRICEKSKKRYEEVELDDNDEYLNEFKKTISSRNNAKEVSTRNEKRFNMTIKTDQGFSFGLENDEGFESGEYMPTLKDDQENH